MNESQFTKVLKNKLWHALPGSMWYKNWGGEYSEKGIPDLTGIWRGRYIGIEVKMNNNWLSPHQRRWLRMLSEAGGYAFVFVKDARGMWLVPYSVVEKNDRHKEQWFPVVNWDALRMLQGLIR